MDDYMKSSAASAQHFVESLQGIVHIKSVPEALGLDKKTMKLMSMKLISIYIYNIHILVLRITPK